MTQQEPYVPYAAMKKRLALALVELEQVKEENERLRSRVAELEEGAQPTSPDVTP